MFKLAAYQRADGTSVNPLCCDHLRAYISDNVLIMTIQMYNEVKHTLSKIRAVATIIVGEGSEPNFVYVKDFNQCLKLVCDKYPSYAWWVIGDNNFANELIWKGVIMDIHLSKCYGKKHTREWNSRTQNLLKDNTLLDYSLIIMPAMSFTMLSNVKISRTKTMKHYYRRNHEEMNLISAMRKTIVFGFDRPNRTGTNTKALFGQHFEYVIDERVHPKTGISSFRLPLLTTKKMFVRGVFEELKWFLSGCTNSKALEDKGVNIWKGNSSRAFLDQIGLYNYGEGECGPIYGFQWRHAGAEYIPNKCDYTGEGVDQIANVVESLQKDPFSRRHIINAWAPNQLSQMVLPPCHVLLQFMCHERNNQKYLTLSMTQRSCDVFLGLPFNICSIVMLLVIMAHRVNMKPFKIIHNVNDFHIYESHFDKVNEQLGREPFMFPFVRVNNHTNKNLEDYEFDDLLIEDYYSHSKLTASMVA